MLHTETQDESLISALPDEILLAILSLIPADMPAVSLVCVHWNEIINSESYWNMMLMRYFPGAKEKCSNDKRHPHALFEECYTTFFNNLDSIPWSKINGKKASVLAKLFGRMRENDFEGFIAIFDQEYIPLHTGTTIYASSPKYRCVRVLYELLRIGPLDFNGKTLLENALLLGHQNFIDKIYQQITEISCRQRRSFCDSFILAVICNQINEVKRQIEAGYDVNEFDYHNNTLSPLGAAAQYGSLDSLQLLLKYGVNQLSYNYALKEAAKKGHYVIIDELLRPSTQERFDKRKTDYILRDCVVTAIKNGNTKIIKLLLSRITAAFHLSFYGRIFSVAVNANNKEMQEIILAKMLELQNQNATEDNPRGEVKLYLLDHEPSSSEIDANDGVPCVRVRSAKIDTTYCYFESMGSLSQRSCDSIGIDEVIRQHPQPMNTRRVLTQREVNFIILSTERITCISLPDLSNWNESIAIDILKRCLPDSSSLRIISDNASIIELLALGADPCIVIRIFILSNPRRALFNAFYAFDDAIVALNKSQATSEHLLRCYSFSPELLCLIFTKALNGEHHLISDLTAFSAAILEIAMTLADKSFYKKINGIIGAHIFAQPADDYLGGVQEKLRQTLYYLEDADKNDPVINSLRLQAYNHLIHGINSGIPQSVEELTNHSRSLSLFKREVGRVYKMKCENILECDTTNWAKPAPSCYANFFLNRTLDDPIHPRHKKRVQATKHRT